MNICVEQGKFEETRELFEELKISKSIQPNNITYNVMLKQLVHMSMRNIEEEDKDNLIN